MPDINEPYVLRSGDVVGDPDPEFEQQLRLNAMREMVKRPLSGRARMRAAGSAARARQAEREEHERLAYLAKMAEW